MSLTTIPGIIAYLRTAPSTRAAADEIEAANAPASAKVGDIVTPESVGAPLTNCDNCGNDLGRYCALVSVGLPRAVGTERRVIEWVQSNCEPFSEDGDGPDEGRPLPGATACPGWTAKVPAAVLTNCATCGTCANDTEPPAGESRCRIVRDDAHPKCAAVGRWIETTDMDDGCPGFSARVPS